MTDLIQYLLKIWSENCAAPHYAFFSKPFRSLSQDVEENLQIPKLASCIIKQRATKTYLGVEVEAHSFLSLVLDGGVGQFHARRLCSKRKSPLAPIG